MTPKQLRKAGERLYGKQWQTAMARDMEIDPSTVRRWASGAIAIPKPVEKLLECWIKQRGV